MLRQDKPVPRAILFALALLLCVALSALHHQSLKTRGSDPVTGTVRDLGLVPAQSLTVRVSQWWQDTVASCFQGPTLARRNRVLTAEVHALSVLSQEGQSAGAENSRLRALLHFQQKSPIPLLAAEVLAIDPNSQTDTLILSRGSADGVRPRTVALSPSGALLGPVLDVSAHSCSVLLLTDSACSVGAQVAARRPPPPLPLLGSNLPPAKPIAVHNGAVGICNGDRAGHMVLTYLSAQADVRPGDLVTTSGLGGVYPKGLPLGTIETVSLDKARSAKTARLRPATDFDHLEQAFLRIKLPASTAPTLPIVVPASTAPSLPPTGPQAVP